MSSRDTKRDKRPPFTQVDNAIIIDPRTSAYDKAVYLALCFHSDNKTRECWPSIKLLSKEAGCGRTSVKQSLQHLLELKYIRKAEQFTRKTGQTSNLYVLLPQHPVVATRPGVGPETTGARAPHDHELYSSEPDSMKEEPPVSNTNQEEDGKVAFLHDLFLELGGSWDLYKSQEAQVSRRDESVERLELSVRRWIPKQRTPKAAYWLKQLPQALSETESEWQADQWSEKAREKQVRESKDVQRAWNEHFPGKPFVYSVAWSCQQRGWKSIEDLPDGEAGLDEWIERSREQVATAG